MRSIKTSLAGAILTLLCSIAAQSQESERKPLIGVRTFENPPIYYNSTIGTGLTDLFTTQLMKTGKYRIVERDGLDELIDEIELSQSSYSEKETALRKGHFKGVEYLFIAKVSNFGETRRSSGADAFVNSSILGSLGLRKNEAYVRIDFRIIDATTREIVYAGYGEGLDKTKGLSAGGAGYGNAGSIDVSSRSFLESQIGRATLKAIDQMIRTMDHNLLGRQTSGAVALRTGEQSAIENASGKVLAAVNDQAIIVSLGRKNGIKTGDTLTVFEAKHIRDSKGNVVYTDERPVGSIRVTDVQEDRSKATRISGEAPVEGDTVRRQ